MPTTLRQATLEDAPLLSDLGVRTFREAFVEDFRVPYSASDLAAFLPAAYGVEALRRYLADPAFVHFVAEADGRAVGYALAGPNGLPHDEASPADGELKRLYVVREAQGLGAGRLLLDAALSWLGPRRIWIGVWSGNERAQRVYEKRGFVKVGEYGFPVGETLDREFILRRG
ncbi:MAG TPA: GNAT family N-acetyltransferase [Polyangiaceae bacterium]|jgi:ribosomal protein S18 acetylase RimI-like enzyme